MSTSRLNEEESELSEERKVRSILKAGIGHKPRWRLPVGVYRRQCGLHCKCPDREGHDGSRRVASELKQLNTHKRSSTMQSAHDTQPLCDDVSSVKASLRSGKTVHTTVPEAVRRHKSNDGTVSSCTVTKYDATLQKQYLTDQSSRTSPIYLSETAQTLVLDITISCPKCGNTEKTQRNELSNELSIY